jgi:hypothetical protein
MESPHNIILNGLNNERNTDLNEGLKLTFIVKLLFVFGIYEIHDYLHYLHPLLLVLLLSGIHVLISLGKGDKSALNLCSYKNANIHPF